MRGSWSWVWDWGQSVEWVAVKWQLYAVVGIEMGVGFESGLNVIGVGRECGTT